MRDFLYKYLCNLHILGMKIKFNYAVVLILFKTKNAHDRHEKAAVMRITISRLPGLVATLFGVL